MFKIEKKLRGSMARTGRLETPHGVIETPAFVVVGTKASVKALTPHEIQGTGAQVVLGNTYHLYLEPGEGIVKQAGGLGKFMGWQGPTMTDSGGFQVFSLGTDFGKRIGKIGKDSIGGGRVYSQILKNLRIDSGAGNGADGFVPLAKPLAKIDEGGVSFKSFKDGSEHRITPERSIEIQHDMGADIIFAFDECTSPEAPFAYQKEAMARTHRWAKRSLERHQQRTTNNQQLLFGIVQGGRFEELRKESASIIGGMEFDGFGIGGSFDKEDISTAVAWVNKNLSEEKPRHLLGIGEPTDLFDAIESGCDLFDCVAPTRRARNGSLYTKRGRISITNARYRTDFTPLESDCGCYTCRNFTRAYLSHLFHSEELLAYTLASTHNLYFIIHLVKQMRQRILEGTFFKFKDDFLSQYKK